MALVRIFSTTGIELEYKQDSLTLKKENNSLSSDFKVPHSSFPFLVIENDVTKSVLGPSDITSIQKNKIVPVIILETGVRYYGELQQLSVLKKFRKCNLKYGSDIIPIVNKKISDFLPSVSVIPGETDPISFTEESNQIISGHEHWETFPVSMIGQIYPEVKFQFPTIYWQNKYGVNLENTDPWYNYKQHLNNFTTNELDETIFLLNTGQVVGSEITVSNTNVPVPHLFLLTPLYYIFSSINWKINGNFTTHELIKRLLIVPKKDNITLTKLNPEEESIFFPENPTWITLTLPILNIGYRRTSISKNITVAGRYKFNFTVEAATSSTALYPFSWLSINPAGDNNAVTAFKQKIIAPSSTTSVIFSGEIEFEAEIGNCFFYYDYHTTQLPINYNFTITLLNNEKEFNQMHPTIPLGRYAPEWTVGNYLNYIKNQFNLDITLDDFKKQISLNLNETINATEVPAVILQSLAITTYDVAANTSFVLKYQNDQDTSLYITQNEVMPYTGNQDDDFTKKIESKFKILPRNGYTSVLSEDINDKEGVGLVIYDTITAPFTTEKTENDYNLDIQGTKGIYEVFFKKWIKFLLNASNCEMTGYFTETEISKITNAKSVYINNQRFRIIEIETTGAVNNYQEVKLKLLSVNY